MFHVNNADAEGLLINFLNEGAEESFTLEIDPGLYGNFRQGYLIEPQGQIGNRALRRNRLDLTLPENGVAAFLLPVRASGAYRVLSYIRPEKVSPGMDQFEINLLNLGRARLRLDAVLNINDVGEDIELPLLSAGALLRAAQNVEYEPKGNARVGIDLAWPDGAREIRRAVGIIP